MSYILIVDDNNENLNYLESLLKSHGYNIKTANHGDEALTHARQTLPDMVVSDLLMPVMDGFTLLRHWRADQKLQGIPFLIYTATYTEAEDEQLVLDLGADDFILKPSEPETFLARLQRLETRKRSSAQAKRIQTLATDEKATLKLYNESLIKKLEKKTQELIASNRALQSDIAKRREAERSLRSSEEEIYTLVESLPQLVWITMPDGAATHGNKKWTEYTGMTIEDSLGTKWEEALHPNDLERTRQTWEEAIKNEEPLETEYRLRKADGSYEWMLARGLPIRDSAGKITKWFGTCTNINELKEAQLQITEQASLLDKATDGIFVRDLSNKITYWNKGAEELYGWTADEAIGRSVTELLHGENSQAFNEAVEQLMSNDEWSGELTKLSKTGEKLQVAVRWTLLSDNHGKPKSILAIDTDVTERKKLEAQFFRAQRLESLGTLAGGIAHDFNNILAPILMSLISLRQETEDPSTLEIIDTLETSAMRGADLVKQVLYFTRGVEGDRVVLNVNDIIKEIQQVIRETFPKSIEFSFSATKDLWNVLGDFTQIHQVLLNLCVNARDAMPNGGKLTIDVANRMLDTTSLALNTTASPGAYVMIEVSDTGEGIPREIQDKIFDPFFTTKDIGSGTGLGLSTTASIIESHGGFVTVYSEERRGSLFKIFLPASTESLLTQEINIGPNLLPHGNSELLLLIDDEEAIRRVGKNILESFGYNVLVARNGTEALSIFAQNKDKIAVVITDMSMPVMDGYSLIKALKEHLPDVRIIATSGLALEEKTAQLLASDLKHFISKPYSAEVLLITLKNVLDKN